jgi:hypothetical protein
MHSKALVGFVALAALIPSLANAARKPCDCANLEQIEREITEQEFLLKMFTQWTEYLPAALRTPEDVRERANMNFLLTFYGAPSQRPDIEGAGAGGAFGTLYKQPGCPLVEYLYKDGKPHMVETAESKREKRNPPELEWATKPTSEAKYKSKQCKALVHYAFVHERSHQATCHRLQNEHRESQWDQPLFFIQDDAAAYKAGLEVLYAERDRLEAKCKTQKHDGRWHGVLLYAYTYNKTHRDPIEKGTQVAQPDGVGYFEHADRKSARLRATIDASDSEPNLKIPFSASRQDFWHHSKYLTFLNVCGWHGTQNFMFDAGTEQRSQGRTSGTGEGTLRAYGNRLTLTFSVDSFEGAFDESTWKVVKGTCAEKPEPEIWDSRKRAVKMDGIGIDLTVPIDPDHPDDVELTRIEPASDGVGQHYYSLKLHRSAAR